MPKIQYRLRDGTLLDKRPTAQSHPWSYDEIMAHARKIKRFIKPEIPSSVPYTVEVTSTRREKARAKLDARVPRPAIPRLRSPL